MGNEYRIGAMPSARAATPSGLSRFASSCQHRITIAFGSVLRILDNAKWALIWRFHPSHRYNIVKTGLPPRYYDQDERMLHASFALLVCYVEASGGAVAFHEHVHELAIAPWKWSGHKEGDPAAAEAMRGHIEGATEELALYHWWTVERPANHAALHAMPASEEWAKLEDKADDADQVMFMRLAKIRRHLWT